MADPKPLASLSAGLLARKGAARPAMRRQVQMPVNGFSGHDDLGWNDMGYDMGYDVNPEHGSASTSRASHGLSPMASPAEPAPVVEPIAPDVPVEASSEPPLVHRHIQRLEDEVVRRPVIQRYEDDARHEEETHFEPEQPVSDAGVQPIVAVPAPAPVAASSVKAPRGRARAGTRGSFAFTLRLDPSRHLRLRLASATNNRSAQQILISLIDDYLSSQPEIDAFAAAIPSAQGKK